MAENKTIQLDVETNLGSLRSQLRAAQQEVAAMADKFGATSTEAANAAKKAAELKDRIEDAKKLTDAFNPDAKFNALSSSIGGVLNGFQAFEGALGVMGVESEDLQKTLLKVQSAMALSQGIQGVFEAKDSFIALGSVVKNSFAAMTAAGRAFALTGIGLVVTAIGGLIYAYQTMNDEAEKAAKHQKDLEKSFEATSNSIDEQKYRLDSLSNIYDNNTRRDIINAKKRGASEEELTRIIINGQKERLKSLEDEVKQAESRYLYLSKTGTTKQFELAQETYLKLNKEFTDLKLSIDEKEADLIYNKRKELNEKNAKKESKDNKDLIKEREDKLKSLNEIDYLPTKQISNAKDARERDLESASTYYDELSKMSGNYLNKRAADITAETKLEIEKRQKQLQMASDAFSILGEITTLFSAKNEKDARKQFKIQKAFNLASAITNTALAVTGALTAGGNPIKLATGMQFVEAGLVAAAGGVNIAKISATQFEGGNTNTDSNIPNANNLTQSMTPTFNVVGGNPTSQLLQGLSMQPLKAYVVASDITTAQMLEQKAIKTSVL